MIQARRSEDGPASRRLDHPIEFWGSPLAPAGTLRTNDSPHREEKSGTAHKNERSLQLAEFTAAAMRFQPHRMLVAATAILATLGVAALAYTWSSSGEKLAAQSPAEQSASDGSGQRASPISVSSADPSVAVGLPELRASITAETPEVATSAPHETTALQETASAAQKEDIVFLQRPGVHIRSAPSTNGRVLGTAPKGMRFKVTNQEGDWVQVESDRFSGWIRSRFLAANEP